MLRSKKTGRCDKLFKKKTKKTRAKIKRNILFTRYFDLNLSHFQSYSNRIVQYLFVCNLFMFVWYSNILFNGIVNGMFHFNLALFFFSMYLFHYLIQNYTGVRYRPAESNGCCHFFF